MLKKIPEGFFQLRMTARKSPLMHLDSKGLLQIPGSFLSRMEITRVELWARLFYNSKTHQILVDLVEAPDGKEFLFRVLRRTKESPSEEIYEGVRISLNPLILTHGILFTPGPVPSEWDPEARTFIVDLSSLLKESKRPVRQLEADPRSQGVQGNSRLIRGTQ